MTYTAIVEKWDADTKEFKLVSKTAGLPLKDCLDLSHRLTGIDSPYAVSYDRDEMMTPEALQAWNDHF